MGFLQPKWLIFYNPKEDTYSIQDRSGYIPSPKELIDFANCLLEFAKDTNNGIEEHNEMVRKENELLYQKFISNSNIRINKYKSRYLYLFECQNKYKIGITDNIERRIKQLDTRPFKLNLIGQTNKLIKDAYKWEQYLHNEYKDQNIEGEWFSLTENQIQDIIDLFGNLDCVEEE